MDEHQPKPTASPSALIYDEVIAGRITRASLLMESSSTGSTQLATITHARTTWAIAAESTFSLTCWGNSKSCLRRVRGLMIERVLWRVTNSSGLWFVFVQGIVCFVAHFDPNVAAGFVSIWLAAFGLSPTSILKWTLLFFFFFTFSHNLICYGIVWMKIERLNQFVEVL